MAALAIDPQSPRETRGGRRVAHGRDHRERGAGNVRRNSADKRLSNRPADASGKRLVEVREVERSMRRSMVCPRLFRKAGSN
jgi:hypothetical protein